MVLLAAAAAAVAEKGFAVDTGLVGRCIGLDGLWSQSAGCWLLLLLWQTNKGRPLTVWLLLGLLANWASCICLKAELSAAAACPAAPVVLLLLLRRAAVW